MDDSGKAEFSIIISAMLEAFGQEATKPRLLGYWYGLSDLDIGDLGRAVVTCLREATRLPSPAELRELAGVASPEGRAIAAWGDVLEGIFCGPYNHVDFGDRIINATIRLLGGWPTFVGRFSDADGEKWARIEFLRVYQSLARSGVDGDVCRPLAGISEAQVRAGRIEQCRPVRIECRDKSRRLLADGSASNISLGNNQNAIHDPRTASRQGSAKSDDKEWQD